MPFALLIIGLALMISVVRNTHAALGQQLKDDLTGAGTGSGFLVWIAALAIVGMLGYIPGFQTPARAFLGLILLAMFIAKKGVFAQFSSAIRSGATDVQPVKEPTLQGPAPVKLIGAGGSGGGGIGGIASAVSSVAGLIG